VHECNPLDAGGHGGRGAVPRGGRDDALVAVICHEARGGNDAVMAVMWGSCREFRAVVLVRCQGGCGAPVAVMCPMWGGASNYLKGRLALSGCQITSNYQFQRHKAVVNARVAAPRSARGSTQRV